jgi:hypothetical protein
MTDSVDNCIVALRTNHESDPKGVGFLITKRELLTCAHVVNACLRRPLESQAQPARSDAIAVTFLVDGGKAKLNAHVQQWWPPRRPEDSGTAFDAAVLEIVGGLPKGVEKAPLRLRSHLHERSFTTFGFPTGFASGQGQSGIIGHIDARQRHELLEGYDKRPFVRSGFSGSPVTHERGIVGMVVAARDGEAEKTGYMIPLVHLQDILGDLDVDLGHGISDDFEHIKPTQGYLSNVALKSRSGPLFDLRVKKVPSTESIAQLFRGRQTGEYDNSALTTDDILNEGLSLLLQSPGGAGKTNFLGMLVQGAISREFVPFVLDATLATTLEPNMNLEVLLSNFAVGGGMKDFQRAIQQLGRNRIILIADRLNENPTLATPILQALIRGATKEAPGIRVIVADRLKDRVEEIQPLIRATLLPLPDSEVAKHLRKKPSALNSKLLAMPFFLQMQLAADKNRVAGQTLTRSKMFNNFFDVHVGIRGVGLERLAESALNAYKIHKSTVLPAKAWTELWVVDEDLQQKVLGSAMLQYKPDNAAEDLVEFRHQLLHDFLSGTHIKLSDENLWRAQLFDAATLDAQSFDAIEFATEQLGSKADEFLKQVYDWNYVAVLESIRNLDAGRHGGQSPVSWELKDAVYCLNAVRFSDRFAHTRRRIESIIEDLKPTSKLDLATARTFKELRERVRVSYLPSTEYFKEWKRLFLKDDAVALPDFNELWRDPLMSWTAANVFRRLEWKAAVADALQTTYYAVLKSGADRPEAIGARWRIVHLLGACPTVDVLSFLWNVTQSTSEDKWVRAGAARSLIEALSLLEPRTERENVLRSVAQWLLSEAKIPGPVLDELRQTAILAAGESTPQGWREDYKCVLEAGAMHARSQKSAEQEQAWRRRMEELSGI